MKNDSKFGNKVQENLPATDVREGTIENLVDKGFGFITFHDEGGVKRSAFFHATEVRRSADWQRGDPRPFDTLSVGDTVIWDSITVNEKGYTCKGVERA